MGILIISILVITLFILLATFGFPEPLLPPPREPTAAEIMPGAEPWRLEGESDCAFLVCHGYGGSPHNTRPLGEFLHAGGHTVIGILLPGHGTTLENLNRSRYYHWRDYLEKKIREERSRYRHFFLVGFSLGGTLCLDVAARNADSFHHTGIITISAPVFFNGFFNGRLILHIPSLLLSGIVKIFFPILKKDDYRPASLEKMNPWVGYRSGHAIHALHSFKIGLGGVRRTLSQVNSPYCNIMAQNDRTVSAENQSYIYRNVSCREKRAYMFILPPDLSTMHSLLTHQKANVRIFRFIHSFLEDIMVQDREGRESLPARGLARFLPKRLRRFLHRRAPEDLVSSP